MGKDKPKVQSILESVFVNAADKLIKEDSNRSISEFCVQLDMNAGEIQVYDDKETLLEKNIIFDWADRAVGNPHPYKQPIQSIRAILAGLKSKNFFEKPLFMRPFKVILTDENFHEIENLFSLEEGERVSENVLMKNLEQELQIFSKKLFADIE